MVRKVRIQDAGQISEIYNYYIENTTVTFEEIALSEKEMKERIEKISSKYPFLVWEENGQVIGYAYATEWKVRAAYRNSVEATIYLKNGHSGKGIGKQLYDELFRQIKENKDLNIHAIIGGIALPNEASVALHEKFGFQKVAHFKEVGCKFQQWIDVAYWELLIN
jgi:L-amino acid N-acyltransferase YncA